VLRTIKFATSLPLDYLSFTIPYPLPGTRLFERISSQIVSEWNAQSGLLSDQPVIFESEFSKAKMRFAIFKGEIEFAFQRNPSSPISLAKVPFEKVTDIIFKAIK
jgi:anaerobic magnesium-protoporphyrin IX monomethyl ester cyclase